LIGSRISLPLNPGRLLEVSWRLYSICKFGSSSIDLPNRNNEMSGGLAAIMETIGKHKIWSFFSGQANSRIATNSDVRKDDGHLVHSYLDLAKKIAELQFLNRDYVLLFRGQRIDHRNQKKNSTLKPTLFRPIGSGNPDARTLKERFELLKRAEKTLTDKYGAAGFVGRDRLRRHRILRWSILQHYEVCKTPLLDITHSIRIAASFASLYADGFSFVFVLGVPNLSGAVTASAEAGLQIIRLSSVCPPSALRPHIREGYLLGEYPDMDAYEQKEHYFHYEIDFGRRLIAKFRFDPASFWKSNAFPQFAKRALYPSSTDDCFYRLALDVRQTIVPVNETTI
jgi:hypothetical protein